MPSTDTPLLTSLRSPRVIAARRLAKRSQRGKERRFLVEGPQAVREAVAYGRLPGSGEHAVVEVYATVEAAERHAGIVDAALAEGLPVLTATDEVIAGICDTVTPQGIVALCRFIDTPFAEVLAARPKLVAVLAHVRDPGNAGTVLRTADAAGADAVVLTDASVDLYNPKAVRASVGSLFHLPVAVGVPVEEAIGRLREAGVRVLAADGAGSATSTGSSTRAPWARPARGCSATRRGGSRRRPARSPTRSCASPSTGTPRASTWPRPPRSACTPRRAPSARPAGAARQAGSGPVRLPSGRGRPPARPGTAPRPAASGPVAR